MLAVSVSNTPRGPGVYMKLSYTKIHPFINSVSCFLPYLDTEVASTLCFCPLRLRTHLRSRLIVDPLQSRA